MSRSLTLLALLTTVGACTRHHASTTTSSSPPSSGGNGSTTTSSKPPPAFNSAEDCPAIQIKAPDSVSQGTKARVTAVLVGGRLPPTPKWSLSSGAIASGQGSLSIDVDTAGLSGSHVTATLDLGGLPTECATTSASAAFLVGP
jgi:hypothetical protein